MPNIICPECSTETYIDDAADLHAGTPDEFCRNCDFPLFWMPDDAIRQQVAVGSDPPQPSTRRLPGTEGIESSIGFPCPHCGELNDPSHERCWRCGNLLVPEPVVPTPEPVGVVARKPIVATGPAYWEPPSWLLVLLGVILAILIVVVLVIVI